MGDCPEDTKAHFATQ
jgi:hypothetical protein